MIQPVEYAVAVGKYLDAADLGDASLRVYRIALDSWAWALVDRPPPAGPDRRGAAPPIVLLAALDATDADERLRRFHTTRGALTANRELSILRSAIAWWREQGWIANDATDGISRQKADTTGAPPTMRLDDGEIRRVFALRVPLREQALWHVVHESGATIERTLALNVADVAPGQRRAGDVQWRAGTTRFMSLLLAGRVAGPVFLTDRRATAGTPSVDRCPQTGRGRLSYRRAAEVFTNATRDLDPRGRGWTLRQLQAK